MRKCSDGVNDPFFFIKLTNSIKLRKGSVNQKDDVLIETASIEK